MFDFLAVLILSKSADGGSYLTQNTSYFEGEMSILLQKLKGFTVFI